MRREALRTQNFVADAAQFILQQARVALAERGEFRIASQRREYAAAGLRRAGADGP